MTMPAKAKTWTVDPNHRVTYTNLTDVHAAMWHAFKEAIKTVSGVTVVGSGDNAAAAMDATDRIGAANEWVRGSSTTAVHTWILFAFANLSGCQLLFEWVGSTDEAFRIAYSPSGAYVVNGTNARFSPTATDEVVILGSTSGGSTFGSSTTSGDRLWSTLKSSDGKNIILLAARAGVWTTHLIFGEVTSAVLAPATFAPAVAGTAGSTAPGITAWTSGTVWKCRANGVNLGATAGCSVSIEGTAGSMVPQIYTSVLDLQGGQWPIMALGIWSTVASARGKIANLIDVWAGNTAAADGDTYPASAPLYQFVAFGDYVLPWDGTPSTAGTPPVMS